MTSRWPAREREREREREARFEMRLIRFEEFHSDPSLSKVVLLNDSGRHCSIVVKAYGSQPNGRGFDAPFGKVIT